MIIVNTSEEYNGEGEEVLAKKIDKDQVVIDIVDASLLCQNRILAKQLWGSREGSVMQVK